MIFRSLVFTFIPTAVELILVCGLLAKAFNPLVAGIVVLVSGSGTKHELVATVRLSVGFQPHLSPS